MRVAVAFDHRGVKLRERVLEVLGELGHVAVDLGTDAPEPRIDYPDKAREVGNALATGAADRAILVCGSGVGASIVFDSAVGMRFPSRGSRATATAGSRLLGGSDARPMTGSGRDLADPREILPRHGRPCFLTSLRKLTTTT